MTLFSIRISKKTLILLSFAIVATININCGEIINHYGLTFQSHEVNQDMRTSLDINPDASFNFSQGSSMEFDLKLHHSKLAYGYVFRMISNNESSLDLIANLNIKTLNFILIRSQNHLKQNIKLNTQFNNIDDKWMKVKIILNDSNFVCIVDSVTQVIPNPSQSLKNIKIYFGSNRHSVFHTTDVPPMTIRNLKIKNNSGKILRQWQMSKHSETNVYDNVGNNRASVEYGIWEIDKHLKWNRVTEIRLAQKNAQIAYDSSNARVFIATSDSLVTYDIEKSKIDRVKTKGGAPVTAGGSHIVYDAKSNKLISYSIRYPHLIFYDFDKNEWSGNFIDTLPPIQQHNKYLDLETNQLIIFGGYGVHKYNGNLIRRNLNNDKWIKDDLSACISPRYLASMGYLGENKLIIMGGYGSQSGKQEEFPQNNYDVFEVDFKNIRCKKIGELSNIQNPLVFGSSMIIEKNENKLYTLAYSNDRYHSSIQLMSFNWGTSEQSFLGDSIPYRFLDTESFCDLFLYKEKNPTIYSIVLHKDDTQNGYLVEIRSLAYPPLTSKDVFQKNAVGKKTNKSSSIYLYIAGLAILLFLVSFISIIVYRRTRKKNEDVIIEDERRSYTPQIEVEKKFPAINLLGSFQVLDKDGEDTTEEFTPVLKQLFLFILLSSINGKRITSDKVDETLWFGMDKLSASNNRSVNIRKLRLKIERLGNINIANKSSYWYLNMGDDIYCDYKKVMALLKKAETSTTLDKEIIESIVDVASAGELLPNISANWVDGYKSEYTDLVINTLFKAAELPTIKKDLRLLLQISNVILLHDNIDEEAIKIKCQTLSQLGQKGASKEAFDKFKSKYIEILNTQPNFNYDDIFL